MLAGMTYIQNAGWNELRIKSNKALHCSLFIAHYSLS